MPIDYVRRLIGPRRTTDANRHLGFVLACVAGASNAGGFLAVKQYTSHMTGIVSSISDNFVLGMYDLVLAGTGGLLSFLTGAICCAVMVNYARQRKMQSEYALPLLLEACLLLCFGVLGTRLSRVEGLFVPITTMLLCFIMGLQNAVITKLSKADIRTTHVTGIVTDIGIELGRLLYRNIDGGDRPRIEANRERLGTLTGLFACFISGGVAGAWGFKHVGYATTVPLALLLIVLASIPAVDDIVVFSRMFMRK